MTPIMRRDLNDACKEGTAWRLQEVSAAKLPSSPPRPPPPHPRMHTKCAGPQLDDILHGQDLQLQATV